MAKTAVEIQSKRAITGQTSRDRLRFWLFTVHAGIVAYVALGWMITWRAGLYFYTLLLPMIALQWLLNDGSSIVTNIDSVWRTGHWQVPGARPQPGFFATVLRLAGIRAREPQITTALCSLMLIFWLCAVCRMILVVPGN